MWKNVKNCHRFELKYLYISIVFLCSTSALSMRYRCKCDCICARTVVAWYIMPTKYYNFLLLKYFAITSSERKRKSYTHKIEVIIMMMPRAMCSFLNHHQRYLFIILPFSIFAGLALILSHFCLVFSSVRALTLLLLFFSFCYLCSLHLSLYVFSCE